VAADQTAVGIFNFSDEAERAVAGLRQAGFSADDISLTMLDVEQARSRVTEAGGSGSAQAARGALAGTAVGGLAGLLVGAGALVVPGLGALLVAGPLAAALTGAAVGAAGGSLVGVLVSLGVPDEQAAWYEAELRRGGTLLAVRSGPRTALARDVMLRHGARQAGDPERPAVSEPEPTASSGAPTVPPEADVGARTAADPGPRRAHERGASPRQR
jgi:hypothetical protein